MLRPGLRPEEVAPSAQHSSILSYPFLKHTHKLKPHKLEPIDEYS